jgi:hypothetical protein
MHIASPRKSENSKHGFYYLHVTFGDGLSVAIASKGMFPGKLF